MQDIWSLGDIDPDLRVTVQLLLHERVRHILRGRPSFYLLHNEVFHIYSQYMSSHPAFREAFAWCGAVELKGFDGPMTCSTNWVSLCWNGDRSCATYPTQGLSGQLVCEKLRAVRGRAREVVHAIESQELGS